MHRFNHLSSREPVGTPLVESHIPLPLSTTALSTHQVVDGVHEARMQLRRPHHAAPCAAAAATEGAALLGAGRVALLQHLCCRRGLRLRAPPALACEIDG